MESSTCEQSFEGGHHQVRTGRHTLGPEPVTPRCPQACLGGTVWTKSIVDESQCRPTLPQRVGC